MPYKWTRGEGTIHLRISITTKGRERRKKTGREGNIYRSLERRLR